MAGNAVAVGVMTVGAYLRDLPPDRRVAMARVCSMIRRSARGVRESMRYGLAFYELDGPLFALASGRRSMSLYVAEQEVVAKHKDTLPGANPGKSHIKFSDLNRLPLEAVEKIVRDSVTARRNRVASGDLMSLTDLLKLWGIKEEDTATTTIVTKPGVPAPIPAALKVKVAKKAKPAAQKAAAKAVKPTTRRATPRAQAAKASRKK
ncbi:MAG TPA: DUF1801 domain-containing protein [Burkholderiaceae bacterium]|nr:DUF1801 domain-containing protein [Burkholderiaceae bacterium]